MDVSEDMLESLPVVQPSHQFPADVDKEEISDAISQLRNGRASVLDEITAEMFKSGDAESVRWFKSLFDTIWSEEVIPNV